MLRPHVTVSVREPRLDAYVHADLKPANVLAGAGITVPGRVDPAAIVEAGLPVGVLLDFAAAAGISGRDVARIVGTSERTISRKVGKDARLAPSEADRAFRLFDAVAAAVRAFGDVAKARRWLQRSVPSLGGQRPVDLLRTELGTRQVLSALDSIEYGGVS